METQKNQLDSWDNFTSGNFLKAADVASENDAYVCTDVEISEVTDNKTKEKRQALRLTLQRNEKESELDLNKTNAKKLKDLGIKSPREVIGKKLYFKKALVRNPQTNVEVEGLRIWKIE